MTDQGKTKNAPSGLMKSAAILGAAAVISKLLGTMQKIPLQNIAGDEIFGLYNAVYPFYILILYAATAGFPIAVSAFVSERVSRNEYGEARKVLKIALAILSVTGLFFFLLLFFGADWIAAIMGLPEAAPALRSVSFALLLVPPMAALRGYFQGLQNMLPTAISQVTEQLFRVVTMVWLLVYLSKAGYSAGWIAGGATFGSVTGALAGLLVMLLYWRGHRAGAGALEAAGAAPRQREAAGMLAKRFAAHALPICLGSLVLPILTIVDTFTMPRLLQSQSGGEAAAAAAFGLYNHGLPLVQLISMIATTMAAALVPAIAEAKERKLGTVIKVRTELAVRLTWLVSLPASFGLAVTAVPLNVMFYERPDGSLTMAILAFTAVFSTVNVVTASILQGFGAVRAPAVHMLLAALVKIVGNLVLIPIWGIAGAAVAAVMAFAAACWLNLRLIKRTTAAAFSFRANVVRPMAAIAVMCAAIAVWMYGAQSLLELLPFRWPPRLDSTIVALGAVVLGAAVYAAVLFRFQAVTKADFAQVPGFRRRVMPWLTRLGWIR